MTPERFRFGLELVIIVGCFLVILLEHDVATETAAFGLLGAVAAGILRPPTSTAP